MSAKRVLPLWDFTWRSDAFSLTLDAMALSLPSSDGFVYTTSSSMSTSFSPSITAQLSATGISHSLLADMTSREYLYSNLTETWKRIDEGWQFEQKQWKERTKERNGDEEAVTRAENNRASRGRRKGAKRGNKEIKGREEDFWVPFVFLPKVAGERDKQHCNESSHPHTETKPELYTLTWQCFLFRQGHTSYAQLRFSPHIQHFLRGGHVQNDFRM